MRDPQELDEIVNATMAHHANRTEEFRAGTRDRDLEFLGAKQHQLDVSAQYPVAASTAHCFVTVMLFPLVVSVNPAVCFVNDPLSEPAVTAVYFAPDAGGCLGLNVTLRAPDSVAFEITVSVEAKYSVSAAPAAWL
jgi:hypothetical protein